MKNKLLKIITVSCLIFPLFSVSCSTTWIAWKKNDDSKQTVYDFKKVDKLKK